VPHKLIKLSKSLKVSKMSNSQNSALSQVLTPVGEVAPVVIYQSGKKEKAIYSATALAVAPLAVRVAVGQSADKVAFDNGQFGPAYKAMLTALTAGQIKALEAHFVSSYSVEVDGVMLAPVGEAIPARASRKTMDILAAWLVKPTSFVKGETVAKPLTKSQASVAGAIIAYFAPATATATEATATEATA
jgi:hypothetical protein